MILVGNHIFFKKRYQQHKMPTEAGPQDL